MIRVDRLTEKDVGRIVVYCDGRGTHKEGRLTSWNNLYVFVRFSGPTGEACLPTSVSFATYGDAHPSQ